MIQIQDSVELLATAPGIRPGNRAVALAHAGLLTIELQRKPVSPVPSTRQYAPVKGSYVADSTATTELVAHPALAVRPDNQSAQQTPGSTIAFADEMIVRRDIVARLTRRDPSALEEIYDRMAGRAFGLAHRILDDGPAAEDVVQDAFVWLWDNSHKLDPERGTVDGLLLTLVHRRAIDALRARSRREALPDSSLKSNANPDAFDLVAEVQRNLDADAINRAMDQLPPEQSEVIDLAYFGGMTHSEICEKTALPLGTVKSRLRLALNGLRNAFGLGGSS